MSVLLVLPKADAPLRLARWLEDEAYGLEHRPELAVIFLFQSTLAVVMRPDEDRA
jgi:hypothetical protein